MRNKDASLPAKLAPHIGPFPSLELPDSPVINPNQAGQIQHIARRDFQWHGVGEVRQVGRMVAPVVVAIPMMRRRPDGAPAPASVRPNQHPVVAAALLELYSIGLPSWSYGWGSAALAFLSGLRQICPIQRGCGKRPIDPPSPISISVVRWWTVGVPLIRRPSI